MTRSVETRSAGLVWMPLRTGFPKNPKTKKQTNQKNRFLSSWPWGEKSLFTLNLPHCGLNMKAHSYIHHFWSSSSGFLQRLKYIPWFVIILFIIILLFYIILIIHLSQICFFFLCYTHEEPFSSAAVTECPVCLKRWWVRLVTIILEYQNNFFPTLVKMPNEVNISCLLNVVARKSKAATY